MSTPIITSRGTSPVILTFPHGGTEIPKNIWNNLNENGRLLADTDWHIYRLYDGLLKNSTTLQAVFHRYVIDANRDPNGKSLYPGQNTTGLCPIIDFDNKPIWQQGHDPDNAEIKSRRKAYHAPYHNALTTEIKRVKAIHGCVIIYDCHSIRSETSYLFDGILPHFNIGSNDQTTCAKIIEDSVLRDCAAASDYSHVLNGRFKGGWTTRNYAKPKENIHCIHMELTQSSNASDVKPWADDQSKANKLLPLLKEILIIIEEIALNSLSKKG